MTPRATRSRERARGRRRAVLGAAVVGSLLAATTFTVVVGRQAGSDAVALASDVPSSTSGSTASELLDNLLRDRETEAGASRDLSRVDAADLAAADRALQSSSATALPSGSSPTGGSTTGSSPSAAPQSAGDAPAAGAGAPAASAGGGCPAQGSVSAILVPSCGAWWGVSPGGSGSEASAVAAFERQTGARTDIYHGYHKLGDMFPTPAEVALARDPQGHRYLLLSLFTTKRGTTWRDVANGQQDGYLRSLATYIAGHYRDTFFFTIHHEPENDVNPAAGSGMTATDFRNMFRHVVSTMRAYGVGNAVWVVNFQGTQKYKTDIWWKDMYPGDDVVDWIGWDSYSCVEPAPGQPCNDFAGMMNRRFSDTSPWAGMYAWATTNHPSKPIFVCEIGVYDTGDPRKAAALRSIGAQISRFPKVKAISYWNSGTTKRAQVDAGPGALSAARETAQNPWFRQSVP